VSTPSSPAAAAPQAHGPGEDTRPTGFFASIGLALDQISGTRVSGVLDLGRTHHTPWGIVHGGVYTAVVETVASVGASAAVKELGQFAVGLNNSTDFLRPMVEGRVNVTGTPVHQGRSQQLWQVVITRDGDGKEVARGTVRLQNLPVTGTAGG
jgi:1,4-dihydroxy-2-naphthoyl-CoA hydrolase